MSDCSHDYTRTMIIDSQEWAVCECGGAGAYVGPAPRTEEDDE